MSSLRQEPVGSRVRAGGAHAARSVDSSSWVRGLVRGGFLARGVTYALIGALVLALALGAGTSAGAPDQQGALSLVADAPLGAVALALIAVGMLAYAVWKISQGLRGRGLEGGAGPKPIQRAANIGGGIAYLALFALAVRILIGAAGNTSTAPRHAAAGVLGWPGGRLIVGFVGVALLLIAVCQICFAVIGRFERDSKTERMTPEERRLFLALGRVGHTARGLVFALIGYFTLKTAIAYKPSEAVGLDGAVARLHHQPLGPLLVALVAVGLFTFAAFSLFEARYRRL